MVTYTFTIIFYVFFFNGFNLDELIFFDWYLYQTDVHIIKLFLENPQIPGYIEFSNKNGTLVDIIGNFLPSYPYTLRSPDIFLLKFLNEHHFILIHTLIIAFISLLFLRKISKYFELQNFGFVFLAITWMMSGSILANIGVGHTQTIGNLLIPGFIYYCFKVKNSNSEPQEVIKLSLLMFVVLLLGGTQTFYHMIVICILFALFYYRVKIKFFIAVTLSCLLGAFAIVPIVLYSPYRLLPNNNSIREVFDGYGYKFLGNDVKSIIIEFNFNLNEVIKIIFASIYHVIEIIAHVLHSAFSPWNLQYDLGWERTFFLGWGVILILLTHCLIFRKSINLPYFSKQDFIIFTILFVFSLSLIMRILFSFMQQFIPISAIDRIPSRYILYPAFILLICVAKILDKVHHRYLTFSYLIFFIQIFTLVANSYNWKINRVYNNYLNGNNEELVPKIFSTIGFTGQELPKIYIYSIWISILTLFICLLFLLIPIKSEKTKTK